MAKLTSVLMAAALGLAWLLAVGAGSGQQNNVNYDETKAPAYVLPDPLVMANGERVTSAGMWMKRRRPELLGLFQENVYGRSPGRPRHVAYEVTSVDEQALAGKAVRREVTVYFSEKNEGPAMHILMYLPKNALRPAPMFLGLNFGGNQSVAQDAGIALSRAWTLEWAGRSGSSGLRSYAGRGRATLAGGEDYQPRVWSSHGSLR